MRLAILATCLATTAYASGPSDLCDEGMGTREQWEFGFGYEVTDAQWAAIYSKYALDCRHEAIWPDAPKAFNSELFVEGYFNANEHYERFGSTGVWLDNSGGSGGSIRGYGDGRKANEIATDGTAFASASSTAFGGSGGSGESAVASAYALAELQALIAILISTHEPKEPMPAPIPLPASVWFMLAGLGMLWRFGGRG